MTALLANLAKIARTMLNFLGLLDLRALLGLLCFAGLRTLCLTRSLAKLASVTQTMLGLLGLLDLRRLRLARRARFARTTELDRVWRLFVQPSFLELAGLSNSLTLVF